MLLLIRNAKSQLLVNTSPLDLSLVSNASPVEKENLREDYTPFLMEGVVSICSDPSVQQPITVLRDTGAAQSLVLENLLPLSEKSSLGCSVLLQGIEIFLCRLVFFFISSL